MDRHSEALECAKENYTLWAMNLIRNPRMFSAVFSLIQSCLHNGELEDAALYAHTAHEMVVNDADGIIPSDQREELLAQGCQWLSRATLRLAEAGGIPPEEEQKAGERAIAAARQALEIHTELRGTENVRVAADLRGLAEVLDYFNNVDDDEVLRLYAQANEITSRLEGTLSPNVATGEHNLGNVYHTRAFRAETVNDLDRCIAYLELALTRYIEAARIFRVINHVDKANNALSTVAQIKESIRKVRITRAASTRG